MQEHIGQGCSKFTSGKHIKTQRRPQGLSSYWDEDEKACKAKDTGKQGTTGRKSDCDSAVQMYETCGINTRRKNIA